MIDIQNISAKAGKLFKKFGIKSITMDDVARETGMSKKTLYQFVTDKSELIERVVQIDVAHFRSEINKLEKSNFDPVREVIELNKLLYQKMIELSPSIEYDLRKFYLGIYEKAKQDLIELFINALKSNIEKGKKEKVYRNDIDPEVIAKLHLSLVDQLSKSGIFSPDECKSPTTAREVCLFHINGLITRKGQLLLDTHMNEIINT